MGLALSTSHFSNPKVIPTSDTLVLCVVFPEFARFLSSYFDCLKNQTANFDLLLINDGCHNLQIPDCKFFCNVVYVADKSISEIRSLGLIYAQELGYSYLVFTDIDDHFETQKISLLTAALRAGFDISFGDLSIVAHDNSLVSKEVLRSLGFSNGFSGVRPLLDKNFLGLSHTACSVAQLAKVSPIPKNMVCADWWIFSNLLAHGLEAKYVPNAETMYLQSNNFLYLPKPPRDSKWLERGLEVKTHFYRSMTKVLLPLNMRAEYQRRLDSMLELAGFLRDLDKKNAYLQCLARHWDRVPQGWWGTVLDLDHGRQLGILEEL